MPVSPWSILCLYMYVQLLIHVKAIAYSCISNEPNVSCLVARAYFSGETPRLYRQDGEAVYKKRAMPIGTALWETFCLPVDYAGSQGVSAAGSAWQLSPWQPSHLQVSHLAQSFSSQPS